RLLGWPSPEVSPATTRSTPATMSAASPSRETGAGLPPRLALVETSGPPQASHSAATTGCALTRTATASCAPRIQPGTAAVAGTTQVCGPGQLARTASREDG